MKILWLDLNCSYAHSSLALPALHAQVMHRADVEWAVVRTTPSEPVGVVVEAIHAHCPDVLAATAWLFTHEHLLHVVSRVKALMPHVKVILGGPEFLGDNEQYMSRHPEVDFVLRGEGEESFAQWIEVWDKPAEWGGIPGLCYVEKCTDSADDCKLLSTTYHDGGIARVADFAALRAPEESTLFTWGKPFVQLETTRGCFNTCAFCVSGMGDPIRMLSIDAIRRRLQHIRERGIRDVRVLDRTFNYHAKRAIDLLQLFAEFHPHLRFHLEIHPALLPQSVRDVLKAMPHGLLHLEAGIQSLRQKVLDGSLRKGTLEHSLDGLRYLCSLPNLVTHADLIAGLPHYTLKQIYEDIHTLAEYDAGEIQLESLKLLPGTLMRRDAAKLGIRYSPLPPYEVLATEAIRSAELQEARRLSRLLDAYYNTSAWQALTRSLILEEEDFLHRFLAYLTQHNYIDQPMSLERRGELLYLFCCEHYPHRVTDAAVAWIEAGMSLKKRPAEGVRTKHVQPVEGWNVLYGEYSERLRLCYLPVGEEGCGYWFGYDTTVQCPTPVFKASL
ncbi:MAG: DUF4080 domain-containing protein [Bacteroidaceae bacterium]|nr:DUF4080 domain-containing protein [Bacteroidaceae bacterium]